MIRLSRQIHFNASRRLWRSDWSEDRNRAVFGDESPHGYGHNYRLEVEIAGEIDPEKAMVVNLTDLDRILKEEVDRPLDHRNLNLDVPGFEKTPPTLTRAEAEMVIAHIQKKVQEHRDFLYPKKEEPSSSPANSEADPSTRFSQ